MRIRISEIKPPKKADEKADIEWLCRSLGLITNRDCDKTAVKIFRRLLRASKEERPVSSSRLSEELEIARGTALFHLQKFSQHGLAVRVKGGKYVLRDDSLSATLDEIMLDFERIFSRMRKIAREIDEERGIDARW